MVAAVMASERDLHALAGIVSEARPDPPLGEGLPPSLLADTADGHRPSSLSRSAWASR
jgi:hypothetical protein